jgi:hypothetical protein
LMSNVELPGAVDCSTVVVPDRQAQRSMHRRDSSCSQLEAAQYWVGALKLLWILVLST